MTGGLLTRGNLDQAHTAEEYHMKIKVEAEAMLPCPRHQTWPANTLDAQRGPG